jgi:hypothetical protein
LEGTPSKEETPRESLGAAKQDADVILKAASGDKSTSEPISRSASRTTPVPGSRKERGHMCRPLPLTRKYRKEWVPRRIRKLKNLQTLYPGP